MQQRMSDSEEEEPQEAEEEYPPWLAVVLDDDDSDHYDRVVLLDDGGKGENALLWHPLDATAITRCLQHTCCCLLRQDVINYVVDCRRWWLTQGLG